MVFLLAFGLTALQCQQLLTRYKERTLQILQSNPYQAIEIPGIGFQRCDHMALKIGIKRNDPIRYQGALLFVLLQAAQRGHCCVGEKQLLDGAMNLLEKSLCAIDIASNPPDPPSFILQPSTHKVLWKLGVDDGEDEIGQEQQDKEDEQEVDDICFRSKGTSRDQTLTQAEELEEALKSLCASEDVICDVLLPLPLPLSPCSTSPTSPSIFRVCYLSSVWSMERELSHRLASMYSPTSVEQRQNRLNEGYLTSHAVERWLQSYEIRNCFTFTSEQRAALLMAATKPLTIITGYPGTGKTAILKALTAMLKEFSPTFLLCSPTGRAASRMQEMTGRKASTCHRALEWLPAPAEKLEAEKQVQAFVDTLEEAVLENNEDNISSSSTKSTEIKGTMKCEIKLEKTKRHMELITGETSYFFARNARNPFSADCVIVDEMSMIDLPLMNALAKAVKPSAQMVLVGDVDQLPAVGIGNVLADLLRCGDIHASRLTQPIRQAQDSLLNANARAVNAGLMPKFEVLEQIVSSKHQNCETLFMSQHAEVTTAMAHLFTVLLPKLENKLDFLRDVQVLTPMKQGPYGSYNLNLLLQRHLNAPHPSKREISLGGQELLRVGDRVMQRINNHDRGVYNGELGQVVSIGIINNEQCVSVEFQSSLELGIQRYKVASGELKELELAWAITVHKSQGSEYKVCVFVCAKEQRFMLYRQLIYTAITRAKKRLIFVGDQQTLAQGVKKIQHGRLTGLAFRVNKYVGRMPLTQTVTSPQTMTTNVDKKTTETEHSDMEAASRWLLYSPATIEQQPV